MTHLKQKGPPSAASVRHSILDRVVLSPSGNGKPLPDQLIGTVLGTIINNVGIIIRLGYLTEFTQYLNSYNNEPVSWIASIVTELKKKKKCL